MRECSVVHRFASIFQSSAPSDKMADVPAPLQSLAAYDEASDSDASEQDVADEHFSGSDDELHKKAKKSRLLEINEQENSRPSSVSSQTSRAEVKRVSRLVSYAADEVDDDEEEDMELASEDELQQSLSLDDQTKDRMLTTEGEMVQHKSTDEILIPPEPPGRCSRHLQDKITKFYEKMQRGQDLNRAIQQRKDFRNPSIYEKLIQYCGIDEKGTNYPPEIYDPKLWGKESFYEELAKVQKTEMEKREKEKKDRTKVEFVTGTKRPVSTQPLVTADAEKRKSKWDAQPLVRSGSAAGSLTATSVSAITTASGTKTTVISAVGTIKKK